MRTISQNPNENQAGISLWTLEDVEKAQAKQREMAKEEELRQQAEAGMEEDDEDDEFGDGGITDGMLVDMDI